MKRPALATTVAFLALAGLAGSALANKVNADPNLGRNLAATCANCHGTNGKSIGGNEALAGLPKDSLVAKLKAFRSGDKPSTVMGQLAKGFDDAQIEAIATYLSAQKK